MMRTKALLLSSAAIATTAALMLTAWSTWAQQTPPAAATPKSAGQAVKAGWKVIEFSSTRLVPIVANRGGGIHHTYGALYRDFLLQKGAELLVCSTWSDNDNDSGEWTEPDRSCGLVK